MMNRSDISGLDRDQLIARLAEAEELLGAIRSGIVDAVVVSGPDGERVYTLRGADHTYRQLVENMDQGAAVLSTDGTILYCNRRLCDLARISGAALVNTPASDLVAPGHRKRFAEAFGRTLARHTAKSEMSLHSVAGTGPPVLVSLTELAFENVRTVCMLVTDLTEQKRTEEALKAYSERLSAKNEDLRRRAEQLRALSSELANAEQRERKRVAGLLHDGLQQHLASAKMQLAWLAGATKIEDIVQTTREVEGMLGEAISMTRSLSMDLSPPVLREDGLAAGLSWLGRWMREKHDLDVDLSIDGGIHLREDVKFLAFESVRELLFNAVKHAGVSAARVQLRQSRGEGGIRITVSDQGRGFDPGSMHGGTSADKGFGLFSIRERVGYIGGMFEIESAPGKGSRFTLRLPTEEAPEPLFPENAVVAGETCAAGAGASEGTIRILLVDDHTLFRAGVARILSRESDLLVVGQAENGTQAVDMARSLAPHVVMMDISMPGMDGIKATRILHDEMPDLRIIGLSMHNDPEKAREMLDAGAESYIIKTSSPAEMIKAIRGSD